MARIRTVKPEFFTSPDVARLSREARLLFIGTWSRADDHGYLGDDAERLILELYPGDRDIDASDLEEWLGELIEGRLLTRLNDAEGTRLLRVVNFNRHQRIDRPSKSRYAVPEGAAPRPRVEPAPDDEPDDEPEDDGDVPWGPPKPKRARKARVDPDVLPDDFPTELVTFVEPVKAILTEVAEGNAARAAVVPTTRAVALAIADHPRKDFLPAARDYRAWQLGGECRNPHKDPVKGFRNQLGLLGFCPDVTRAERPGEAPARDLATRTAEALRELEA